MQRLYVVLLLILLGSTVYAQQDQPLVAIVVDRQIGSLSFVDEEDGSGITQLTAIFQGFGAKVITIPLNQPVPEEVDVIVLVRPVSPLNATQLARLWASVHDGANLFIALDPRNYLNIQGERPEGGLNTLLTQDYGTGIVADLLASPWFSADTLDQLPGGLILTHPEDIVTHPVTAPLLNYDLSVLVWAGRSVEISPLWPDAVPVPLVYSETVYGESMPRNSDEFTLEMNIGPDILGRLFVGSLSTNNAHDSRLVLLGDSQMIEDTHGLSLATGTDKPNFPGNYILAQRLAAWILELPEEEWPVLLEEFAWIAIDGDAEEWNTNQPRYETDFGTVQPVHTNEYFYFLLESDSTTPLEIRFVIDNIIPVDIRLSPEGGAQLLTDSGAEAIPDAAVVYGDVLEARIPLRLITRSPVIDQICREGACHTRSMRSHLLVNDDPSRLRFAPSPLGTVDANGPVPAYTRPDAESESVGTVIPELPYILVGRSEDGLWVKLQDGSISGWVSDFQVIANTDIMSLPVLDE